MMLLRLSVNAQTKLSFLAAPKDSPALVSKAQLVARFRFETPHVIQVSICKVQVKNIVVSLPPQQVFPYQKSDLDWDAGNQGRLQLQLSAFRGGQSTLSMFWQ